MGYKWMLEFRGTIIVVSQRVVLRRILRCSMLTAIPFVLD